MKSVIFLSFVLLCGVVSAAETAVSEVSRAQTLDDFVVPGTMATILGTGYKFSEGPAADPVGNIYFSDGGNDTIHFYPYGRPIQVFVSDSVDANGMMFNHRGELVSVEGALRQIVVFNTRTAEKRVIVKKFGDTEFNEPNDLTIDTTNGFYFTDPYYAHRKQGGTMKENVYYVSAAGEVTCVSEVCKRPNGIHLSLDEKTLYVGDNGTTRIYKYDVVAPGKLENETVFTELAPGSDGMTLDSNGNLYVACSGNGVRIFSPSGDLIGSIDKQYGVNYVSNCVFGGPNFSILYMTSRDKFLGIPMKVAGKSRVPQDIP